jgi:hypothetical protein
VSSAGKAFIFKKFRLVAPAVTHSSFPAKVATALPQADVR